MKRPLLIVLRAESPYDLINVLGPFLATIQTWDFCGVGFTDTFSAGKTRRKITKILQSFGF